MKNEYFKNLSLLYVEDDNEIRDTFSKLLKKYFKQVYIAKNGQEALELYKKYMPDIVITDIRMPIMDGIELSKKIKEINPDALIIVITAFSDIDYLKKAIDIGIDAYLTKPIELDKLFEKLNFFAKIIKDKKEKNEYYNLLQKIFDHQTEAILLVKEDSVILHNQTFKKFFKIDPKEILEKIDVNNPTQILKINNKTYKINIQKINSYILISFIDITNYEDEIFKDSLTNLYNRKILAKIINDSLNKKICLIILDIDNFKKINDTFGHLVGDKVLIKLSEILKNSLRKEDIIIRWGGEEFLIFLKNIDNEHIASKIAEKIKSNIENSHFEKVNKVTASFGVCCGILYEEEDFEKLLKNADDALYCSKIKGKNRVCLCKDIN